MKWSQDKKKEIRMKGQNKDDEEIKRNSHHKCSRHNKSLQYQHSQRKHQHQHKKKTSQQKKSNESERTLTKGSRKLTPI